MFTTFQGRPLHTERRQCQGAQVGYTFSKGKTLYFLVSPPSCRSIQPSKAPCSTVISSLLMLHSATTLHCSINVNEHDAGLETIWRASKVPLRYLRGGALTIAQHLRHGLPLAYHHLWARAPAADVEQPAVVPAVEVRWSAQLSLSVIRSSWPKHAKWLNGTALQEAETQMAQEALDHRRADTDLCNMKGKLPGAANSYCTRTTICWSRGALSYVL